MVHLKQRPQLIILDIKGVIATKEFEQYSEKKKKFFHEKIKEFVSDPSQWKRGREHRLDGQLSVIYRMARTFQSRRALKEGEPLLPKDKEEQPEAFMNYVLYCIEKNPKDFATFLFLNKMTYWGYKKEILKTPLYEDVIPALRLWKQGSVPIYLNIGGNNIFDMLVKVTDKGNIRNYFTGHKKMEWKSRVNPLKGIVQDLRNVLFVTHSTHEANNARNAGLQVVMIVRRDIDPDWKERMKEESEKSSPTDSVSVPGTGPIMIATKKGLVPIDDIPNDGHDNEDLKKLTENSSLGDIFTQTSIITYDDTRNFHVIESLAQIKFP